MSQSYSTPAAVADRDGFDRLCFSCGRPLEKQRRKYCSSSCKDEIEFKLKWFNNLLRVINARYATFSFNESILILNVISSSTQQVHTYFYPRTPGKKPAQDIDGMVFELGHAWWYQKESSKSERQASNHVLKRGKKELVTPELVKPKIERRISRVAKHLVHLKLPKEELLHSPDPEHNIKAAYRKAALQHHPDQGGDANTFRKIHRAYEELKAWLKNPTYQTRRGVPGQWSFIARNSKWYTPL